jgi:hypothetical protein
VRQGNRLARALLVKDVATVAAMVLPVCKGKSSAASHAHIGVDPFGRLLVDICQQSTSLSHKRASQRVTLTALLSIMLLETLTRGGNW